jgi:hypothetical protein
MQVMKLITPIFFYHHDVINRRAIFFDEINLIGIFSSFTIEDWLGPKIVGLSQVHQSEGLQKFVKVDETV